jgi:hypothetical protein
VSAHSPGPWRTGFGLGFVVYDAKGAIVAAVDAGPGRGAQCQVDARLIAAAPELLAMVREQQATIRELVGLVVQFPGDDTRRAIQKTIDGARALIARIEGA